MLKRLFPVWLIFQREVRDQVRDWRVLLPMLILSVAFPFLIREGAVAVINFTAQYGGNVVGERVIPFFMLIAGFLPVTVSLVIALETFVGEKERGTIEPLLSTPLKDWQLYMGKLLAGTVVPVASGYGAIGLYLYLIVRAGLKLPDLEILIQTFALTAVQALLMITAAIAISTQSTSVRAANLLASFVILPVAILIQGETVLMFWGNNKVLWLAVAGVTVMAGLLVRLGLSHFQREYLLGREIDILNLRWLWRTFWQAFSGGQKSIPTWYASAVWPALKKIRVSAAVVTLLGLLAVTSSYYWLDAVLPGLLAELNPEQVSEVLEKIQRAVELNPESFQISVAFIFGRNLRAMVVMMLAGLFSFSVLGILVFFINVGLIGVVLAVFKVMGFAPGLIFTVGILPHGVFELPALFLSAAAVLRMGVVLVTPDTSRTIGEVLIESLADWCKVTLGVIVPLLLVSAVIETYITPLLLLSNIVIK